MDSSRFFASDNTAGVHPAVMAALAEANAGHARAYGHDPATDRAIAAIRGVFGAEVEPYFVFLGTAANVLALRALLAPWQAVICTAMAHINTDECGAAESLIGCKLFTVASADGKLRPEDLDPLLRERGNEHRVQPRVVSITQATEVGTVYRPEEVRALADAAHERDLYLHMDGARLANAAAFLGCSLAEITTDCGVDVLSFGGTKNGLMFGEAVVFLKPELARHFKYHRKQSMQLISKMRYIAAQFEALLTGGLWLENARRANAMARRLAAALEGAPELTITRPVEANGLFVTMPLPALKALQQDYYFYILDETAGLARWMTAYDTAPEAVDAFAAAVRRVLRG